MKLRLGSALTALLLCLSLAAPAAAHPVYRTNETAAVTEAADADVGNAEQLNPLKVALILLPGVVTVSLAGVLLFKSIRYFEEQHAEDDVI